MRRLSRLFDVYGWFYRDAIWRARGRTLAIAVLDVVSIALAGAVLGAGIQAVRGATAGEPLVLPRGLATLDTSTAGGLVVIGAVILVLGVLSALTAWITRRLVRRTAAEYQHFCAMRVLRIAAGDGPQAWTLHTAGHAPRDLLQYGSTLASQFLHRCCAYVLLSIRHTIIMVVAGAAALIVNPVLVLLLLPLLAVYLLVLSRLSRRAGASVGAYRSSRNRYRKACRAWIRREPGEADDVPGLEELERQHAEVTRRLAVRRLMVAHGQFFNAVLFSTTIAVLFVFASIQLGRGQADWAGLLIFVVCLRFFVSGLRNNTETLVRLHIYASRIEPYRRLLEAARRAGDDGDVRIDGVGPLLEVPETDAPTPHVVVLSLPWDPSPLDLDLATLVLARATAGEASPPSRRLRGDAGEEDVGAILAEPSRWLVCLGDEWRPVSKALEERAPGGGRERLRVLLVDSLLNRPRRTRRHARRQPIAGVAVWGTDGIRGTGDWDWYRASWESMRAEVTSDDLADSDDDAGEDEE
ncbi:MAG: hypothetical protein ACYTG1_01795 [Planctomycetota bacterium]